MTRVVLMARLDFGVAGLDRGVRRSDAFGLLIRRAQIAKAWRVQQRGRRRRDGGVVCVAQNVRHDTREHRRISGGKHRTDGHAQTDRRQMHDAEMSNGCTAQDTTICARRRMCCAWPSPSPDVSACAITRMKSKVAYLSRERISRARSPNCSSAATFSA
jgi:hypothetical protein